jgi:hypothetical protein
MAVSPLLLPGIDVPVSFGTLFSALPSFLVEALSFYGVRQSLLRCPSHQGMDLTAADYPGTP